MVAPPPSDGGSPGLLPLGRGVHLDPSEVTWRFSASGGPGGQHVNTSNTRAEASFAVSQSATLPAWARDRLVARLGEVVSVAASDTRSQARNRELALARLAGRLFAALAVQPARKATRPSLASKRRRLEAKRRRAQTKANRNWEAGRRSRPDAGD